MINFFANCAIFVLPSKIISTLIRPSDDDGVIIQTKLYTISQNYSSEEKYHWIPRIEKELEIPIHKLQLNDISYFNNYNELKLAALEAKEIFLNQLELAKLAQIQSWGDWVWDNKIGLLAIASIAVLCSVVLYIYLVDHADLSNTPEYKEIAARQLAEKLAKEQEIR